MALQQPCDQHHRHRPDDHVEVGVDTAGLHTAKPRADVEGAVGQDVHDPIDDVVVEEPVQPRDAGGHPGAAVHDAVDDGGVEPGPDPRQQERTAHEHQVVQLVDVVLVVEDGIGTTGGDPGDRVGREPARVI